jgi:hypothetical protein
VIAVIYAAAFAVHLARFFEHRVERLTVRSLKRTGDGGATNSSLPSSQSSPSSPSSPSSIAASSSYPPRRYVLFRLRPTVRRQP